MGDVPSGTTIRRDDIAGNGFRAHSLYAHLPQVQRDELVSSFNTEDSHHVLISPRGFEKTACYQDFSRYDFYRMVHPAITIITIIIINVTSHGITKHQAISVLDFHTIYISLPESFVNTHSTPY
jgi:hypothetical protein